MTRTTRYTVRHSPGFDRGFCGMGWGRLSDTGVSLARHMRVSEPVGDELVAEALIHLVQRRPDVAELLAGAAAPADVRRAVSRLQRRRFAAARRPVPGRERSGGVPPSPATPGGSRGQDTESRGLLPRTARRHVHLLTRIALPSREPDPSLLRDRRPDDPDLTAHLPALTQSRSGNGASGKPGAVQSPPAPC